MSEVELDSKLVEKIVRYLAEHPKCKSRDLASTIGVPYEVVRDALVELEGQGIVFRTGRTRGTRWWLG